MDSDAQSESDSKIDKERLVRENPNLDTTRKSTSRDSRARPSGSPFRIMSKDPFRALQDNLEDVHNHFYEQDEVVR